MRFKRACRWFLEIFQENALPEGANILWAGHPEFQQP